VHLFSFIYFHGSELYVTNVCLHYITSDIFSIVYRQERVSKNKLKALIRFKSHQQCKQFFIQRKFN